MVHGDTMESGSTGCELREHLIGFAHGDTVEPGGTELGGDPEGRGDTAEPRSTGRNELGGDPTDVELGNTETGTIAATAGVPVAPVGVTVLRRPAARRPVVLNVFAGGVHESGGGIRERTRLHRRERGSPHRQRARCDGRVRAVACRRGHRLVSHDGRHGTPNERARVRREG